MSDELRQTYLGALTELVGTVSQIESTPLHADSFCKKHNVKPSFLDALRDLDGLEMDFAKPCTDGFIYFKKTPTLYQIEPEAVLLQIRKNNMKKGNKGKVPDEIQEQQPDELTAVSQEPGADTVTVSTETPADERPSDAKAPCSGSCGMNYCDDNGCMDRKRILVDSSVKPADSESDLSETVTIGDAEPIQLVKGEDAGDTITSDSSDIKWPRPASIEFYCLGDRGPQESFVGNPTSPEQTTEKVPLLAKLTNLRVECEEAIILTELLSKCIKRIDAAHQTL